MVTSMNSGQIRDDLKQAQLLRDEIKVSTLRLLLSEIKNSEIAKGHPPAGGLSDEDIIAVLQKEIKKRKEAVLAFRSGGREDQAQKEEAELKILTEYLPAQMEVEELTKIVDESINEVGASSLQDMGKVMGLVMSKVSGRADGSIVSSLVKERLSR